MKHIAASIIALFFSSFASAVEIYEAFPEEINADERYVIYSHGLILEGNTARPEHSEYGAYEFEKVKESIFDGGNFNLIAHHRPSNTDIEDYVNLLESWVLELVDNGVSSSSITLVGFSRGSHLTALASARLSEYNINTALLASCMEGDIPFGPPLEIGGNLLSIYETSDVMGSCANLAEHSPSLVSFREIQIATGQTHGAFFRPLDEWVAPLRDWIRETNH